MLDMVTKKALDEKPKGFDVVRLGLEPRLFWTKTRQCFQLHHRTFILEAQSRIILNEEKAIREN